MSLADLENLSKENLASWAFLHRQQHQAIVDHIYSKSRRQLITLPLDPMEPLELWLEFHQSMHNDFCSTLRIAGNDFSGLDLSDEVSLRTWIRLHIQEHTAANERLGIE